MMQEFLSNGSEKSKAQNGAEDLFTLALSYSDMEQSLIEKSFGIIFG
jgi:hypothetical protein